MQRRCAIVHKWKRSSQWEGLCADASSHWCLREPLHQAILGGANYGRGSASPVGLRHKDPLPMGCGAPCAPAWLELKVCTLWPEFFSHLTFDLLARVAARLLLLTLPIRVSSNCPYPQHLSLKPPVSSISPSVPLRSTCAQIFFSLRPPSHQRTPFLRRASWNGPLYRSPRQRLSACLQPSRAPADALRTHCAAISSSLKGRSVVTAPRCLCA